MKATHTLVSQVLDLMPHTGQPGPGHQLLSCHWPWLLLLSGHQEQGSTQSGDQEEEAEPLNTPQKCQAQGRICQKEASLFSWDPRWWWRTCYCTSAEVWPMWLCWSFRKGVKTTHEDEAQDQWSSTPAGGTQRFSKCCETSGSISSEGNPRGAATWTYIWLWWLWGSLWKWS